MPPKISLCIHTASQDNFLAPQGIPSYFDALCHCLRHQTFTDFELVYVDTFYDDNRKHHSEAVAGHGFTLKHVAIHPQHRYWYDQGFTYIAAAKNTGIIWSDGELLVSLDDAELFDPNLLERYWYWYSQHGCFMIGLHRRCKQLTVIDGLPAIPLQSDNWYLNDHRAAYCNQGQFFRHRNGQWCYAGTSVSLSDALELNGVNERCDGCKSLEDAEFGQRIVGLGRSLILDATSKICILNHQSYADASILSVQHNEVYDGSESFTPNPSPPRKITNKICVENQGMCDLNISKANSRPYTEAEMNIIRSATIKYRNFDPLSPAHLADTQLWAATPCFDLREQRNERLRNEQKQ